MFREMKRYMDSLMGQQSNLKLINSKENILNAQQFIPISYNPTIKTIINADKAEKEGYTIKGMMNHYQHYLKVKYQ